MAKLRPGTRVSTQDEGGEWCPTEVLAARSGVRLVHPDGFDDLQDDSVELDRIRE